MSQHIQYWNKKRGKGAGASAMARHASEKSGQPKPNPTPRQTGAQAFLQKLKAEIKRAV